MTSMLGAMLVVLTVIVGFVGVRAVLRNNDATPVPTVEYAHMLQTGKADGTLQMLSPKPMPSGWRATSARFSGGPSPHWHLGVLTSSQEYVGLEEARTSVANLLEESVKGDVTKQKNVVIAGQTWREWQAPKGDYVLTRSEGDVSLLIRGTAPASVVRGYVARLKPA